MRTEPEGLLAVDKPAGPTSHDVVAAARRALGTRRIGHTGTLDPFASGLLLLLVGRATRLAEYFADLPKRYVARMRLGTGTDTDDRTGRIVAEAPFGYLAEAEVRRALERQVGERLQRPPVYSAKKVAGRRAYAAARDGQPLELEAVPVRIDDVRVGAVDLPDVEFEVTCGAGTYIRSMARDAGDELGVPAHLAELRRVAIGTFAVEAARSLDELSPDDRRHLVTPADALGHLIRIEVEREDAARLVRGMAIPVPGLSAAGPVAAVREGVLIAVGEARGGRLAPRKVFADG